MGCILLINPKCLNKCISDFTIAPSIWNFDLLRTLLPNDIILKTSAILPPTPINGDDYLMWRPAADGRFTFKSAYHLIVPPVANSSRIWDFVWSWKGSQKLRVFMWLVTHNRILTATRKLIALVAVLTIVIVLELTPCILGENAVELPGLGFSFSSLPISMSSSVVTLKTGSFLTYLFPSTMILILHWQDLFIVNYWCL